MLNDPLKLARTYGLEASIQTALHAIASDQLLVFRLADLGPGSSMRVTEPSSGDKFVLKITHSETKENTPYPTTRTVLRLDRKRTTSEGVGIQESAYLVIASPTVEGVMDSTSAALLARDLALFVLTGGADITNTKIALSASDGELARLLAGEP